jgi:hypothetical protein
MAIPPPRKRMVDAIKNEWVVILMVDEMVVMV